MQISLKSVGKVKERIISVLLIVAMDFFGFRNVLKAAMDDENLALAQEEATLTKIRTLLNQHKVGGELWDIIIVHNN